MDLNSEIPNKLNRPKATAIHSKPLNKKKKKPAQPIRFNHNLLLDFLLIK